MNKCDCYCEEEITYRDYMNFTTYTETHTRCKGTKERDLCSCGGDRAKCNFYPEVRKTALREIEPKVGEWISVKDRLPKINEEVIVYRGNHYGDLMNIYIYLGNNEWEDDYGYWGKTDDEGITCWTCLPQPPKGD